jgi:hypothetical protein
MLQANRVAQHPWCLQRAQRFLLALLDNNSKPTVADELPTIDLLQSQTERDRNFPFIAEAEDFYTYAPRTPKTIRVQVPSPEILDVYAWMMWCPEVLRHSGLIHQNAMSILPQ